MKPKMPEYWSSTPTEEAQDVIRRLDSEDRDVVALVQTIVNMTPAERRLSLLILHSIVIWRGLQAADEQTQPLRGSESRFKDRSP